VLMDPNKSKYSKLTFTRLFIPNAKHLDRQKFACPYSYHVSTSSQVRATGCHHPCLLIDPLVPKTLLLHALLLFSFTFGGLATSHGIPTHFPSQCPAAPTPTLPVLWFQRIPQRWWLCWEKKLYCGQHVAASNKALALLYGMNDR
jgi:hypothetical protein